jgi:hypothetical protein
MTCQMQRAIDDHFSGQLRPSGEEAMRAHLPGCTSCRERYARHLLLARLTPSSPSAKERLGRANGLSPRPLLPRIVFPALAAAAAAILAVAFIPGVGGASNEFQPRGGAVAEGSRLRVFRVEAGGNTVPVGAEIRRDDELAFAYQSSGKAYLAVFAVDEHQHVYWYFPRWEHAEENPTAVAIESGGQLHALPEAVSHALDGTRLTVHGWFLDRPVSVREIEGWVSQGQAPGADHPTRALGVTP